MPDWIELLHLQHVDRIFDTPALTLALAMSVGMAALATGSALRLPGILLALAAGVLLGPDFANIVRPAVLGDWLRVIVGFCVSVILFEGALSLNPQRLKRAAKSVRRLVTVGALIAACGAAAAAHYFMGWRWEIAALFGSLLIVTGPTVISPLLRRIKAEKTVSTVLAAEGVLGDAVGAVLATVVFGIAVAPKADSFGVALSELGRIVLVGGVVGFTIGLLIAALGRWRRLTLEGLGRVTTLALVVLAFQLSNSLAHESGVVAAVVAGMTVGSLGPRKQEDLIEFKEELSILFIGLLFVLLAANVRIAEIIGLAERAGMVALALVLLVRPLSVLISTIGAGLNVRQRLFIAWIGPRGIVAAAVASLFATELASRGAPEGAEFRAVVFLTIVVTVTLAGFTGWPVGKLLGVLAKTNQGWLIFGANRVSIAMGVALQEAGDEVVLVDRNREAIAEAEAAGLHVINGNGLEVNTLLRAGIETRRGVIAMTGNDEVNLLFVQTAKRMNQRLQLWLILGGAKGGVTERMLEEERARMLGGRKVDIALLAAMLEEGRGEIETRKRSDADKEDGKTMIRRAGELPLLVRRGKTIEPAGSNYDGVTEIVLLSPRLASSKNGNGKAAKESGRRAAVPPG
ncbi:MAG: cation:proton antiporter [Planctomycetes bacterium]|nr:cation:proton antiporter [Planctomycetota bacterium]